MFNLSTYNIDNTASTSLVCAEQRAKNLKSFGCKKVLELCVGPSLNTLTKTYNKYDIEVWGNDIEYKYKKANPNLNWIIGDCFKIDIDYNYFDWIVFAPPLSKNCSGKRNDSLSIDKIIPNYSDALKKWNNKINLVLVLPGRSFSNSFDRNQYYKLISKIKTEFKTIPLKNKIIKYVDVYIRKNN